MKNDFFAIYDALLSHMDQSGGTIKSCFNGEYWSIAETESHMGVAMTTHGCSISPMFSGGFSGLCLKEAAEAAKSWNFMEAGLGMAAVNAWYNTERRLEQLSCFEPFEKYCTDGLDFRGKTVALIGHMHGPEEMRRLAKEVHIIEREPQSGDYPDSACDYILPRCDIVLITGSSLVNKTLPHLLELCSDAYTILTGPTVPMCPELLELGFDRLAGLVVCDRVGMRGHVSAGVPGSPYGYGRPFLLKR